MNNCESFLPCANSASEILILGSMPGVKSLEKQQYYAHPQNRFWKVMAWVCGVSDLTKSNYCEKLKTLLENNIALWDVVKSCKRKGSLDSDISNEIPNDIRTFLKKYPKIKTIYLNGGKSYSLFKKYFPDLLEKYDCFKLPSTSPANARYNLENLIKEWNLKLK